MTALLDAEVLRRAAEGGAFDDVLDLVKEHKGYVWDEVIPRVVSTSEKLLDRPVTYVELTQGGFWSHLHCRYLARFG